MNTTTTMRRTVLVAAVITAFVAGLMSHMVLDRGVPECAEEDEVIVPVDHPDYSNLECVHVDDLFVGDGR